MQTVMEMQTMVELETQTQNIMASNMECYAVYSSSSLPVLVNIRSPLLLPSPFPDMVAVFAVSSESSNENVSLKATLVNHDDNSECFNIGLITSENRAFCWQPHLSKDFTMPVERHNYHLLLDQDEVIVESSETESQEIVDSQPEAERLCSTVFSSPSTGRSVKEAKENEETPQQQVQGTPHRPPSLSHSASKKRKCKDGEDYDKGTPQSSRKRQSRQRPSTPLSSSLSSANQKRLQNAVGKKENDAEPSARWGHTLCDVGNHKCLLLGGQGQKQTISRDAIWMLNTETVDWSVPSIEASSDKFPSRMGHTATFDRDLNCVFVFGGSKNLRWFSDMHVLDLGTMKWSLIEAAGKAPTRAYHSATFFRKELYVFGGVYPNPDPQPDGCSNDVFIFNPESKSWYKPVTMGTKPKARSGHSATLLGDKLVIFGGWDAPVCYNDLHILDLCLMEFTSPKMMGTPPSPRSWHASIALPGNKVLIHGGYNGNEALSDAFIIHLDTFTWSQVELHSRVPVGIRAGHAITSYHGNKTASKDDKENIPMIESLAIFGGGDNEDNFFGDLIPFSWTYSNFLDF